MIKCNFIVDGKYCVDPETKSNLKNSYCYDCDKNKDSSGHRFKNPIYALYCSEFCEEETCNIGEITEN